MRYTYLGDALTDKALVGMQCDPVRRADGKCVVNSKSASALVVDAGGHRYVVKRRRLRLNDRGEDMGINRIVIAMLLNTVANELDARYGPHPNVPKDKVKEIANEVIDKGQYADKDNLKVTLAQHIDLAFGSKG